VGEQFIGDVVTAGTQIRDSVRNIGRVPIDDCCDYEVKPGCSKLLGLVGAVNNPALLEGANGLRKLMALFTFVKACLTALPQSGAFQPIEHK